MLGIASFFLSMLLGLLFLFIIEFGIIASYHRWRNANGNKTLVLASGMEEEE